MSQLIAYFTYPFVRYALVVVVLIALSASLLGVTLVLKRFSFIGDGLSHVAFGAMAIATALKLSNNMYIILPVTVLSAILLLRVGRGRKIRGDAVLAMISVGAIAVGYLLLNKFSPSANISGDVCGALFGSASILTLSAGDVVFCAALSAVVALVFVLTYNKMFAVTFDETFAAASGVRTGRYNLLYAIIIALVVVMAMNMVGTLLISALVVFPALSAMRVCRSFRGVVICSAIVSACCAVLGLLASILFVTPVGASIVVTDMLGFLIFWVIGKARTAI